MRPWRDLFPDILPAIPVSMPDPTVVHHIRRATQDFCRRTRAWRELLDPVVTQEGQRRYDLEFPPMAELVRIEGAMLGAEPIGLERAGYGCRRFVHTPDGKTSELSFAPGAGLHLVIDASLMPSNESGGMETNLLDMYAGTISEGAIARLTSDGDRMLRYEHQCDVIKTAIWRGRAATRPRAVPHWF